MFRTLREEGLEFKIEKIWFVVGKQRKGIEVGLFSYSWIVHDQFREQYRRGRKEERKNRMGGKRNLITNVP